MLVPILKRIAIGVVLATLLVIVVGLLLPSSYEVSRSVVIAAPQARVHEFCGNLKSWPLWTPWFTGDPDMTVQYGPTTTGEGAHWSWSGYNGNGELTFTRCDPAWGVAFEMFLNDHRQRTEGSLQYGTAPAGVEVVWTMAGEHGWNILSRYFGLSMDYLVGPMFEEGLEKLKAVVEAEAEDRQES